MFSFEFPRAHREVVRYSNVEIVRDFDSRGRATDVWFRFNNYVVFALEVKHDQLGRIHQWRRKVRSTCIDFHLSVCLSLTTSTPEYVNTPNTLRLSCSFPALFLSTSNITCSVGFTDKNL